MPWLCRHSIDTYTYFHVEVFPSIWKHGLDFNQCFYQCKGTNLVCMCVIVSIGFCRHSIWLYKLRSLASNIFKTNLKPHCFKSEYGFATCGYMNTDIHLLHSMPCVKYTVVVHNHFHVEVWGKGLRSLSLSDFMELRVFVCNFVWEKFKKEIVCWVYDILSYFHGQCAIAHTKEF